MKKAALVIVMLFVLGTALIVSLPFIERLLGFPRGTEVQKYNAELCRSVQRGTRTSVTLFEFKGAVQKSFSPRGELVSFETPPIWAERIRGVADPKTGKLLELWCSETQVLPKANRSNAG